MHGVDVSIVERDRILARADELEPLVRIGRDRWFVPALEEDPDFPGGFATRTAVVDGACVFLRRDARGCLIHAALLARGEDYHALKPMVSTLFPVTFGDGALLCSDELHDESLVCAGDGPTAARGESGELHVPVRARSEVSGRWRSAPAQAQCPAPCPTTAPPLR